MQVDSSIFKAYDIRGVVDKTLTEDVARAVGRVLGSLAVEANVSAFCVGRDGRLSGERLMNALVEGIASTGMKVLDVGAVPTPVLYYATKYFNCGTGVAVTGSHNPPEWNGLKMMVAGITLFADAIQDLLSTIRTLPSLRIWRTLLKRSRPRTVTTASHWMATVIVWGLLQSRAKSFSRIA